MLFDFESDFAHTLHCIPMIARRKLDLCGIKLTLRQWNRFSHSDRQSLLDMPGDTGGEQAAYRAHTLTLIATRSDEPARDLPMENHDGWKRSDAMPDEVASQAAADGVPPPSAAQWATLSELQRFALIKLARSKHENENFVPAMKEFGLLP